MNIVYLLENKNKTEGRRFYIGSKTECAVETVDGIDRIVSLKDGHLYYGSSSCPTMKQDMQDGHIFNARILENVPNKKLLLETENKWIKHFNAVESPEYYNIAYATIGGFMIDQYAIFNTFGETVLEYGKLTSSINKRQNNARKYGFKNLGELSVFLYCMDQRGYSQNVIARILGCDRYFIARYYKEYDMEKCIKEYNPNDEDLVRDVRLLLSKGASVKKIAELKGIEIPTVCMYIGDYDQVYRKSFLVAQRRGQTKEELEIDVTKLILDGMGFDEAARHLGINATSAKRYFLRCIRSKLKSSDL